MLSGNDVEVDDGDYHQRTALHLAASNGHIAMVRHLVLIHGANMNVLDRSVHLPPTLKSQPVTVFVYVLTLICCGVTAGQVRCQHHKVC